MNSKKTLTVNLMVIYVIMSPLQLQKALKLTLNPGLEKIIIFVTSTAQASLAVFTIIKSKVKNNAGECSKPEGYLPQNPKRRS